MTDRPATFVRWGAILLLVGALSGSAREAAPAVTVCQPLVRDGNTWDFSARIEPAATVAVRAPIAGTIAAAPVKAGDFVKKGDLLFEIDAGSLKAAARAAEKAVQRGVALLKQRDDALAKARGDPAQTPVDLDKMAAERNVVAVTLDLDRAELGRVQADLERGRVAAPLSGKVEKPVAAAGDKVDAGPRSATLLCKVVGTDPVQAAFDMDEATLLRLQQHQRKGGQKAEAEAVVALSVGEEKNFPHVGRLDHVDHALDPKTGRVRCRAVFPNADGGLNAALFAASPGPARVRVTFGAARKVLLVPALTVGSDAAGNRFVLVVDGKNVVQSRRVKLGERLDGLQAIDDGLQPDDWIVLGSEKAKRDPADKTLSPDDFATDLQLLGVKPETTVAPVRVTLPDPAAAPKRPK